jgi:hypothetical protein
MAGLVPAIHVLPCRANQVVGARNKCGHDEVESGAAPRTINPNSLRLLHVLDMSFCSRGADASEFFQSHGHEKLLARKSHARSEWSAGRRRGRGPRHADGCCHPPTLRAWRAPQNDPLARTACFGRAAPPGAPPPSRFAAAAVDRRRASSAPAPPAGTVNRRPYGERDDSLSY